jgi:hypothetical protein
MPRRSEQEWDVHKFDKESKLQDFIIKRLKEYRRDNNDSILFWKASDSKTSGISDIILCVHGTFVAVELKIEGNKPTALQGQFLKDVVKAGGVAGVAYNWQHFKDIINPVLRMHSLPTV